MMIFGVCFVLYLAIYLCKHHVNLLLQSFRSVSSDLHYANLQETHLVICFLAKNTTMRFIQNAHTTFFTCEKYSVQ